MTDTPRRTVQEQEAEQQRLVTGERADAAMRVSEAMDAMRAEINTLRAQLAALRDEPRPSEPVYYAEALDLVADHLTALKPEELEARAPKLVAVIRNSARALREPRPSAERTCATCRHWQRLMNWCRHPEFPGKAMMHPCPRTPESFGCTLHEPAPEPSEDTP